MDNLERETLVNLLVVGDYIYGTKIVSDVLLHTSIYTIVEITQDNLIVCQADKNTRRFRLPKSEVMFYRDYYFVEIKSNEI